MPQIASESGPDPHIRASLRRQENILPQSLMSQTPKLRRQQLSARHRDAGAIEAPPIGDSGDSAPSHLPRFEPFTRRHLGYLMLFTLIAAVLRLYHLGEWSLWIDEAHTYRDVTKPFEAFWSEGTSHYPLSFLLLRGMAYLFGLAAVDLDEKFMRLPFAFFGIASVPAIAIVARGMIGRRSALLAALFLALSPWHIYWSQNARSYSMVLFLSLIAMGRRTTDSSGARVGSWRWPPCCTSWPGTPIPRRTLWSPPPSSTF